jgi:hypothetical protein
MAATAVAENDNDENGDRGGAGVSAPGMIALPARPAQLFHFGLCMMSGRESIFFCILSF